MPASLFRLMTLLLMALAGTAAIAQAPTHIAPRLVAESMSPRAGATTTLAFAMTPQPGWHGYWKNPGDAGVETQVTWTLPPGVRAGALAYPVPQTLLVHGIMNYVYEGPFALTLPLSVAPGIGRGTKLPVRAKLDWLECTETLCVPASAQVATTLTVGDGAVAPAARLTFDRYRAALPRLLGSRARFSRTVGQFRLAVPLPATMPVTSAYFFPLTEGTLDHSAPQRVSRSGDLLIVEAKAGSGRPGRVTGVLKLGTRDGFAITADPGVVPVGGRTLGTAADGTDGGGVLLAALGGAFLGGILLNIMPCVFPILSLKALSLAKAGGGSERAARIDALAYAAGVVIVCLALGGGLLALRAGGAQVGWAFQLQDSRVILLLLLLTAAIAFNLAGLFELPMLSGGGALAARGGAMGSFWTGALAAFVATPCTGPFMAGALGVALVLPTAAALAVFAGLGLGIAFPFLLIGFVPVLRRRLPKPGAWMATLRHILAVPMLVTALGLAWVLGRQAGPDALIAGLAALLLAGLAFWWVGLRQRGGRARAWVPAVPLLIAALLPMALAPAAAPPATRTASTQPLGAEPFSEARLAALTAAGTPTFVYFTADWCLSCKVNEKAVLERQEVADAFAAKQVHVLVGDWTNGDAAIGRFLAEKGRSGVPLYLYYAPGRDPIELPQLLTVGTMTALTA